MKLTYIKNVNTLLCTDSAEIIQTQVFVILALLLLAWVLLKNRQMGLSESLHMYVLVCNTSRSPTHSVKQTSGLARPQKSHLEK